MAQEEMDVSVIVRSTCMVTPPSIKPHVTPMFLPALDALLVQFHYTRRLLFYKVNDNDFQSVVDLLKSSLQQVLVDFYPLCGRLALSPVDGRLQIDFDFEGVNHGVEFVEAYTDDVVYSELAEDGFELRLFFDKLCKWSHYEPSEIFHIPLLSIQVTKLKDNGMVLGYANNHVLADGCSMWNFMKSWSECARGSSISMPPLHKRELFRLDNPCEDLAIPLVEDSNGNSKDTSTLVSISNSASNEREPSMIQRLFCFTIEMIQRLKKKVTSERGGEGVMFTSYQVLAAHFWRCVTRARCLESSISVHFWVVADCRGRLNPPLPLSYFGNCLAMKYVQTTAGELMEETLAETAMRIRKTCKSCATHKNLWGLIHSIELYMKNPSQYQLQIPKSNTMVFSSSSHFPCYEIDFGLSGRPEAVRSAFVNEDGEMVIFPRSHNNDGSVDICMALPSSTMNRLIMDTHFHNF